MKGMIGTTKTNGTTRTGTRKRQSRKLKRVNQKTKKKPRWMTMTNVLHTKHSKILATSQGRNCKLTSKRNSDKRIRTKTQR